MKTSIIDFSVENFKIFRKRISFSMETYKNEHSFNINDKNLLRTSLIYGPNASGKSSLLDAFNMVLMGVINSANNPDGSSLPHYPFLLSNETDKESFFEIIFLLEKKIYKYNFSVQRDKIVTENLSEILNNEKEKKYLVRRGQDIDLFNDLKESKDIIKKTRKEVLFLSAACQWNDKLAMSISKCFKNNINVISGLNSDVYRNFTVKMFKDNVGRKKILEFLKKADFCINDGEVAKIEIPEAVRKQIMIGDKDLPNEIDTVIFSHNKFDSENNKIGAEKFNMGFESMGTQKFFSILGPIIDSLENGKALLIDEFDNSLHPFLTKFIVDQFENNNPNNAQLIATTHDTSLLAYKDYIKDQFWFTEKDKYGAGNLFSLAEFDLRNDTEYSKKYLEGRFGALPYIDVDNLK